MARDLQSWLPGITDIEVLDEGVAEATRATSFDFVGAGVDASVDDDGVATITISGGGSGLTVKEEGVALTTLGTSIDFVGVSITASGTGAAKTVTCTGLFGAHPVQCDSVNRSTSGTLKVGDSTNNTSLELGNATTCDVDVMGGLTVEANAFIEGTLNCDGGAQVLTLLDLQANFWFWNTGHTHKYNMVPASIAADHDLNLPLLVGNDTLVAEAFAQTLSNKTLSAPIVTGTVTYQGTRLRILSIPGEVQTTDATVTTVASFAMNDETLCAFDVVVTAARGTNVTKGGRWKRSVVYRRTSAGAPTIVGTLESGTDEETDAGLDVTIDVSSNTVRVRVTGIIATNFNWTCELRVQETLAT